MSSNLRALMMVCLVTTGCFSLASTAYPQYSQTETFSECVLGLYKGPYSRKEAALNCLNAYRGKQINETMAQCASALYGGPYSRSESADYCSQAYSASGNSSSSGGGLVLQPTKRAGSYWVYEKPANVTVRQMQAAGARLYDMHESCMRHYSLCTSLSDNWLSEQPELIIQERP